jgi:hypothetical protein
MKQTLQPKQLTFEDLAAKTIPARLVPRVRTTTKLVGQPFISPIANIPTNRTPLSPTFKLR